MFVPELQFMISCNREHTQGMTIQSYFLGLFLEAIKNVVRMREPATVEKSETPPGWAWEKTHMGGAKRVRQRWHNFGSEAERMLSINISDCVSYRVTTLENSGLRGISRLRVAYGQTQKQRAATFHDLKAEPDGLV